MNTYIIVASREVAGLFGRKVVKHDRKEVRAPTILEAETLAKAMFPGQEVRIRVWNAELEVRDAV